MELKNMFGGATVRVSVEPALAGTPPDSRLAPGLTAVLSLLDKAYASDSSDDVYHLIEAFCQEVDIHLDNRRLGKVEGPPPRAIGEMEFVMDKLAAHRKEKK